VYFVEGRAGSNYKQGRDKRGAQNSLRNTYYVIRLLLFAEQFQPSVFEDLCPHQQARVCDVG